VSAPAHDDERMTASSEDVDVSALVEDEEGEENTDDWEDIESDEEDGTTEPPSKTRAIYKFFLDKAYKPRGISDL